jgi:hypothetical protein
MSASQWRPVYELWVAGAGYCLHQGPACASACGDGTLVRMLPEYTMSGSDLNALFPLLDLSRPGRERS